MHSRSCGFVTEIDHTIPNFEIWLFEYSTCVCINFLDAPGWIFCKSCVQQLHIMMQGLTLGPKQGIISEWKCCEAARESCSQTRLAQWAKNRYQLQQVPNHTSISRALSRSKWLSEVRSHSAMFKKQRKSKAPNLDKRSMIGYVNEMRTVFRSAEKWCSN